MAIELKSEKEVPIHTAHTQADKWVCSFYNSSSVVILTTMKKKSLAQQHAYKREPSERKAKITDSVAAIPVLCRFYNVGRQIHILMIIHTPSSVPKGHVDKRSEENSKRLRWAFQQWKNNKPRSINDRRKIRIQLTRHMPIQCETMHGMVKLTRASKHRFSLFFIDIVCRDLITWAKGKRRPSERMCGTCIV